MSSLHPSVRIHPSAIVSEGATIGAGTEIGPYSVVGEHVSLGTDNRILSHVVIDGHTTIGDRNTIYQFASVGAAPQDLKYHGEPSELFIGNDNIIREYATLQPGTEGGGMKTIVGDKNLFMVCSHVGHDGIVGSRNVFANSATLAGHVTVGNGVIIGGLAAIHQFARLGDLAMVGGGAMVSLDIPPFCIAQGDRANLVGINVIGLERSGFSPEDVRLLKSVYRSVFFGDETFKESVAQLLQEHATNERVSFFLEFLASAERGVAGVRKKS